MSAVEHEEDGIETLTGEQRETFKTRQLKEPPAPLVGPYPLAVEAHPTLRQSLLSSFDDCPLSARFSLDHEKGWSDHLQAMGTIFHRFAAAALMEMHRQNEDKIEVDVALAIMSETLRQADVPLRDMVAIPMEHVADLRWMTVKWALDNRFDVRNLVDVEQRLRHVVRYPNPEGGFVERVLTGALDALLIENLDDEPAAHAIILDWKSGWGLPPATGVSPEGYFQQRWYALLVMRAFPSVMKVTTREFYVRRSEPREASLLRRDIDDLEAEMAALAERFDRVTNAYLAARTIPKKQAEKLGFEIDADAYRPAPGKHCSYCPAPFDCPVYPQARRVGRLRSEDEAALAAAELLVAEAAIDGTKKALKAWTTVHGSTPIRAAKDPNRKWGPREQGRVKRPSQDQIANAMARGIDPQTLFVEEKYVRFGQHSEADMEAEPIDELLQASLSEATRRRTREVARDAE